MSTPLYAGNSFFEVAFRSDGADSNEPDMTDEGIDGIISDWSAGAILLYGYAKAEVIGHSTAILAAPQCADEIPKILRNIWMGKTFTAVATHVTKDGTIMDVALSAVPSRDNSGKIRGATIVVRAADESKHTEVANSYLTAVFESSHAAIYGTTIDGLINLWNQGAQDLFGYTHSEIIGQPLHRLSPPSLHRDTDEILMKTANGEEVAISETTRVKQDGSLIDVSVNFSPVKDTVGRIIGTCAIAQGISAHKVEEAALQYSKEVLNGLFEQAPDAICVVDKKGILSCLNAQAEVMFGYPKEELVGKEIEVLLPERFRQKHLIDRQQYLNDPESRPMGRGLELCAQRKNGSEFPVDIMLSPIAVGKGTMIMAVIRDISESKQLQESLRRNEEYFRMLISGVQDYEIIVLNPSGNVISWNEGAQRIKQYTADEILGKYFSCFYTDADIQAGKPEELLHEAARAGHCTDQGWRKRRDGSVFWADVAITAIKNAEGQLLGYTKVSRDITEQRQYQRQIELSQQELQLRSEGAIDALNKRLQQEILQLEALNRLLEDARDQALQASKEKSVFVATISHELRSPLSGIIASIELLLCNSSKMDDETLELLQIALTSAQSLLSIVNDLLDLAKIESGKMLIERSRFDPTILVQEATAMFAHAAETKGVVLSTYIDPRLPPQVIGDRLRVRQVLMNLISNAIKFTQSGEVCVKAFVDKALVEEGDDVVIRFAVRDTGIGISEDDQKLLFKTFSQVGTSVNRQIGGVGLGLAVSKNLVELMGGTIEVESKPGQGSEFSFRVVFQQVPVSLSVEPPRPLGSDFANKRVLLVEDSPVIQRLIARQLETFALQVDAVTTGKDALNATNNQHFDLVLMDCNLPDISGFEVTREIRKAEVDTHKQHIPIVAMTANAMIGDRENCLAAGMDDYLSKPVSMKQLEEKLRHWLPLGNLASGSQAQAS